MYLCKSPSNDGSEALRLAGIARASNSVFTYHRDCGTGT
jgi:hypothetical protein